MRTCSLLLVLTLTAVATPSAAQNAKYMAPRTENGQPDLTWLDYAGQIEHLRTSLVIYPENGRLPKLVEGIQRAPSVEDFIAILSDPKPSALSPALLAAFGGGRKDGYEDLGASDR